MAVGPNLFDPFSGQTVTVGPNSAGLNCPGSSLPGFFFESYDQQLSRLRLRLIQMVCAVDRVVSKRSAVQGLSCQLQLRINMTNMSLFTVSPCVCIGFMSRNAV